MLSLIYITSRKEPHFDWFISSLRREMRELGDVPLPELVVIDFHHSKDRLPYGMGWVGPIKWASPKPTPWQGKYRLTDHDAFAASNARNTGLCLASGTYIVFIDDVSVLVNGWLAAAMESMRENRITCGAYRKVKELAVDMEGNITRWIAFSGGDDTRWKDGRSEVVKCPANWLYGCSFGAPVETLLSVNGFDEALDGLSFEDVCLGLRLEKAGHQLWYDQKMLTFESEEAHHVPGDEKFKRHNRPIAGHQDLAWWMLDHVKSNHMALGTPDLRTIRNDCLSGKAFPNHAGMFVFPDGKNLLGY